MSRIAPDIPELRHVPDAMRSIVYMRALNAAIRSPLTWTIGAVLLAVCVTTGAMLGAAFIGGIGTFLGTLAGASTAVWSFFKLILPWRTRRMINPERV